MTRKLLYISGAFSDDDNIHGVERNIILASEAALQGWRQGWTVICPHKNTKDFQWATDISHDVWVEGDLEMAEKQKDMMTKMCGCKREDIKVVGFGIYLSDGESFSKVNHYVNNFDESKFED